jgi:hypothetical protein
MTTKKNTGARWKITVDRKTLVERFDTATETPRSTLMLP